MLTIRRQVLDVGTGSWDKTIVRASNPQRRDVQIIPAYGYAVRPFSCLLAVPCSTLPC